MQNSERGVLARARGCGVRVTRVEVVRVSGYELVCH